MSTQEQTLNARSKALQVAVSEMLALEEQIGIAAKRQIEDKNASTLDPQVNKMLQLIARQTEKHTKDLEQHLRAIGGDPTKSMKEMATAAIGAIAGWYDKNRTVQGSKMLRDDYTALNLAAIGYTMLHTTGVAVQSHPTSTLAMRHLKDYISIITELTSIVPSIVVAELKEEGVVIVESSVQQALRSTQDAWKPLATGVGTVPPDLVTP
jgi:hypothetical protein